MAELLADHHASGRLDTEEFENRLGSALTARTSAELGRLLADLPISTPDGFQSENAPDETLASRPSSGSRPAGVNQASPGSVPAWTMKTLLPKGAVAAAAVGGMAAAAALWADAYYTYILSPGPLFIFGCAGLATGRLVGWWSNVRKSRKTAGTAPGQ